MEGVSLLKVYHMYLWNYHSEIASYY
jgi:hypothetical protein